MSGLRFAVGDRVRCLTGNKWQRGIVVALSYREAGWPADQVSPYQVELDCGPLVHAPQDSDRLVRADDGCAEEAAAESQEENAGNTGKRSTGKKIHVCQAGPCRRAGGEAVLLEIEELANSVGGVSVEPSGCLGNCSQAPNALLESGRGTEQMFAKRCKLSDSAEVVQRASGTAPSMDDPEMVARLQRARKLRVRMEAREESKWNLAMAGLREDVEKAECDEDRAELAQEHAELLAAAGFGDRALEALSAVLPSGTDLSLDDIPTLRLLLDQAKIIARLGRLADFEDLRARVANLQPRDRRQSSIRSQVLEVLEDVFDEAQGEAQGGPVAGGANGEPHSPPERIQDYARWRLDAVTPASKHSAVYHFRSEDGARGTPIRRGRGGRTVWSKTWHTTLLAQIGEERNTEGPLPWIERDYTPISTAHDWEAGKCDILIKIYLEGGKGPGLATEWLHRVSSAGGFGRTGLPPPVSNGASSGSGDAGTPGAPTVWLSKPMKTLHVPSLAVDETLINRKHASTLLLVAGTGVVAVPQVLHHASAATCFGASAGRPTRPPITQPVSVIYSCRTDDALLIPELAAFCQAGALARCTVLLTASTATTSPFPDVADADVGAAFSGLANAACISARLSPEILRAELDRLERPLRVVVSGPEGFNGACKSMLQQLDGDLGAEAVTVLSA